MERKHSRRAGTRSQSATEYLMTYGWAILIIAIVTASLFELGVFSGSGLSPNSCLPVAGFVCTNVTLNSGGQLGATIGEIGTMITITNTYCTNSSAAPSETAGNLGVQMGSDSAQYLLFSCPITSTATGTSFTGSLWIEYDSGTQTNVLEQIARVKASVERGGGFQGGAIGYANVVITNSNDIVGTGGDFQQMLTIDSAEYGNYINAGWTNVGFTAGAPYGAGGTPIYAWVESNPSNTATATTVWLKLPNGIGAGSSTTVYMNFMTDNVMVSGSSYTGEAPQLSPTYAEYDNGASVFNNYWNFAGTSLPSGWAVTHSTASSPSINNGATISSGAQIETTSKIIPIQNITEMYIYLTTVSDGGGGMLNSVDINGNDYTASPSSWVSTGTGAGDVYYGQVLDVRDNPNSNTNYQDAWSPGITVPTSANSHYLMGMSVQSDGYFWENYILEGTITSDIPPAGNYYLTLGSNGASFTVYYIRTRAYPPNGVMPSATFGSFVGTS